MIAGHIVNFPLKCLEMYLKISYKICNQTYYIWLFAFIYTHYCTQMSPHREAKMWLYIQVKLQVKYHKWIWRLLISLSCFWHCNTARCAEEHVFVQFTSKKGADDRWWTHSNLIGLTLPFLSTDCSQLSELFSACREKNEYWCRFWFLPLLYYWTEKWKQRRRTKKEHSLLFFQHCCQLLTWPLIRMLVRALFVLSRNTK